MLKTIIRSNQIVTYFQKESNNNISSQTKVTDNQAFTKESKEMHKYSFLYDFSNISDYEVSENEAENSGKNHIVRTGYLSYKAQRDIKRRVDTWTEAFIYHKNNCQNSKKKNNHYFTFVTLTYPSKQIHSDQYLKREHLNHFIIKSKRDYKIENYLWRAEVQENGNLHFHLLYDKYIHWKIIKDDWNEIIERDNYVTEYQKRNGKKQPNSTDVHGLKNISNISAYISKYMSKNEDKETQRRKIDGNLHGCSDKIRDIKQLEIQSLKYIKGNNLQKVEELNRLIDFIRNSELTKWEADKENYSTTIITKIPMREILQNFGGGLSTQYTDHYKNLSKTLFT